MYVATIGRIESQRLAHDSNLRPTHPVRLDLARKTVARGGRSSSPIDRGPIVALVFVLALIVVLVRSSGSGGARTGVVPEEPSSGSEPASKAGAHLGRADGGRVLAARRGQGEVLHLELDVRACDGDRRPVRSSDIHRANHDYFDGGRIVCKQSRAVQQAGRCKKNSASMIDRVGVGVGVGGANAPDVLPASPDPCLTLALSLRGGRERERWLHSWPALANAGDEARHED